MADLTLTAANVRISAGTVPLTGTAGATITAGVVLYRDAADGKLKIADANDATKYQAVGIALHGASNGQPLAYIAQDLAFVVGAAVVIGTTYYLSRTAGLICPAADVTSADYGVIIGVANTITTLRLNVSSFNRADNPKA